MHWELADGVDPGSGMGVSAGTFTSDISVSYPPPVILHKTLRLNSSSELLPYSENASYVDVPTNGASHWVTFSGLFGNFPNKTRIAYTNVSETSGGTEFDCVVNADPILVVQGPVGEITNTSIVCRTETGEGGGLFVFFVTVGNQYSLPGSDILSFSAVPLVTSVSGCANNTGIATVGCDTSGGDSITIRGQDFGPGMVLLFQYIVC